MAKEKKDKEDPQLKVIASIVGDLQKKYGKESITYLGNNEVVAIPRFSSCSVGLDDAMGGGYPRGRIVEIYGLESTGKSTLCYHAIAEEQKTKNLAALIDAEYAFDPIYARQLGVDIEKLIVSQPNDGTEGLNILIDLIERGVSLIVVDSVAALMPKEEADAGLEQQQMGVHARMMSRGLKKITQATGSKQATVLFTNQIRQKIGGYGNPETTSGGNALKFYASVRIKTSKIAINKEGEDKVSIRIKAQVVKNKTAVPFKETEFTIRFGKGIDELEDIITKAVDTDVILKKGSWYSYKGEQVSQGQADLRTFLENTPAILEEIRASIKGKVAVPAQIPDDEKKEIEDENEKEDEAVSVESV